MKSLGNDFRNENHNSDMTYAISAPKLLVRTTHWLCLTQGAGKYNSIMYSEVRSKYLMNRLTTMA